MENKKYYVRENGEKIELSTMSHPEGVPSDAVIACPL